MLKTHSSTSLKAEIAVVIFLLIFFFYTDKAPGFVRKIQEEEYWLYRFPRTPDYYPSRYLWRTLLFVPPITIGIVFMFTKDRVDAAQALVANTLSTFLSGSLVNCIKLGVGRPRPDFLARCFPDGVIKDPAHCTGNEKEIIDGYKSFPSGHSALCFACLGFLALYLAGKLHVFNAKGRGSAWRKLIVVGMLLWPTMIAVSRTADYHHHWQDVLVGGILGMCIAYLVYRSYYPSLQRINSHLPYVSILPTDTQISYMDHPISPTSPYSGNVKLDDILKTV